MKAADSPRPAFQRILSARHLPTSLTRIDGDDAEHSSTVVIGDDDGLTCYQQRATVDEKKHAAVDEKKHATVDEKHAPVDDKKREREPGALADTPWTVTARYQLPQWGLGRRLGVFQQQIEIKEGGKARHVCYLFSIHVGVWRRMAPKTETDKQEKKLSTKETSVQDTLFLDVSPYKRFEEAVMVMHAFPMASPLYQYMENKCRSTAFSIGAMDFNGIQRLSVSSMAPDHLVVWRERASTRVLLVSVANLLRDIRENGYGVAPTPENWLFKKTEVETCWWMDLSQGRHEAVDHEQKEDKKREGVGAAPLTSTAPSTSGALVDDGACQIVERGDVASVEQPSFTLSWIRKLVASGTDGGRGGADFPASSVIVGVSVPLQTQLPPNEYVLWVLTEVSIPREGRHAGPKSEAASCHITRSVCAIRLTREKQILPTSVSSSGKTLWRCHMLSRPMSVAPTSVRVLAWSPDLAIVITTSDVLLCDRERIVDTLAFECAFHPSSAATLVPLRRHFEKDAEEDKKKGVSMRRHEYPLTSHKEFGLLTSHNVMDCSLLCLIHVDVCKMKFLYSQQRSLVNHSSSPVSSSPCETNIIHAEQMAVVAFQCMDNDATTLETSLSSMPTAAATREKPLLQTALNMNVAMYSAIHGIQLVRVSALLRRCPDDAKMGVDCSLPSTLKVKTLDHMEHASPIVDVHQIHVQDHSLLTLICGQGRFGRLVTTPLAFPMFIRPWRALTRPRVEEEGTKWNFLWLLDNNPESTRAEKKNSICDTCEPCCIGVSTATQEDTAPATSTPKAFFIMPERCGAPTCTANLAVAATSGAEEVKKKKTSESVHYVCSHVTSKHISGHGEPLFSFTNGRACVAVWRNVAHACSAGYRLWLPAKVSATSPRFTCAVSFFCNVDAVYVVIFAEDGRTFVLDTVLGNVFVGQGFAAQETCKKSKEESKKRFVSKWLYTVQQQVVTRTIASESPRPHIEISGIAATCCHSNEKDRKTVPDVEQDALEWSVVSFCIPLVRDKRVAKKDGIEVEQRISTLCSFSDVLKSVLRSAKEQLQQQQETKEGDCLSFELNLSRQRRTMDTCIVLQDAELRRQSLCVVSLYVFGMVASIGVCYRSAFLAETTTAVAADTVVFSVWGVRNVDFEADAIANHKILSSATTTTKAHQCHTAGIFVVIDEDTGVPTRAATVVLERSRPIIWENALQTLLEHPSSTLLLKEAVGESWDKRAALSPFRQWKLVFYKTLAAHTPSTTLNKWAIVSCVVDAKKHQTHISHLVGIPCLKDDVKEKDAASWTSFCGLPAHVYPMYATPRHLTPVTLEEDGEDPAGHSRVFNNKNCGRLVVSLHHYTPSRDVSYRPTASTLSGRYTTSLLDMRWSMKQNTYFVNDQVWEPTLLMPHTLYSTVAAVNSPLAATTVDREEMITDAATVQLGLPRLSMFVVCTTARDMEDCSKGGSSNNNNHGQLMFFCTRRTHAKETRGAREAQRIRDTVVKMNMTKKKKGRSPLTETATTTTTTSSGVPSEVAVGEDNDLVLMTSIPFSYGVAVAAFDTGIVLHRRPQRRGFVSGVDGAASETMTHWEAPPRLVAVGGSGKVFVYEWSRVRARDAALCADGSVFTYRVGEPRRVAYSRTSPHVYRVETRGALVFLGDAYCGVEIMAWDEEHSELRSICRPHLETIAPSITPPVRAFCVAVYSWPNDIAAPVDDRCASDPLKASAKDAKKVESAVAAQETGLLTINIWEFDVSGMSRASRLEAAHARTGIYPRGASVQPLDVELPQTEMLLDGSGREEAHVSSRRHCVTRAYFYPTTVTIANPKGDVAVLHRGTIVTASVDGCVAIFDV